MCHCTVLQHVLMPMLESHIVALPQINALRQYNNVSLHSGAAWVSVTFSNFQCILKFQYISSTFQNSSTIPVRTGIPGHCRNPVSCFHLARQAWLTFSLPSVSFTTLHSQSAKDACPYLESQLDM